MNSKCEKHCAEEELLYGTLPELCDTLRVCVTKFFDYNCVYCVKLWPPVETTSDCESPC